MTAAVTLRMNERRDARSARRTHNAAVRAGVLTSADRARGGQQHRPQSPEEIAHGVSSGNHTTRAPARTCTFTSAPPE